MPQFQDTVEINAQEALRITGFQPLMRMLDTASSSEVRIGTADGNIGFQAAAALASGSFIAAMVIQRSGDIKMSGKLSVDKDVVLTGGDCAEHFDAMPDAMCEPGTVMAINNGGALDASTKAYDKKVAGVVSGAGSLRPAILLDHQLSDTGRPAIALVGKVYCKVDADYAAIELGDLLTTSDTLGHAMKVSDPGKAFGAVIGKALRAVPSGRGLIPILIALQ